jgi:hypothetical protein
MRVRHVLIGAGLLAIAVAAPASAAGKPDRGCSNDGFVAMTYPEFRQLSLDVGVPEELLGEDHAAHWLVVDRSGDGVLCVKDLKDTSGHLWSWVFNVVDNTSNH